MTTIPTHPVALSCAEDRYDCGHISRSSSRPVKRALFLYLAEVADLGYLGTRTEAPEVLAVLVLMRQGAECADVIAAGGAGADALYAARDAGEGPVARPLTPHQVEALRYVAQGYSYPEIGEILGKAKETVRSLVKAAMVNTLTHSAMDAAVQAAEDGLL